MSCACTGSIGLNSKPALHPQDAVHSSQGETLGTRNCLGTGPQIDSFRTLLHQNHQYRDIVHNLRQTRNWTTHGLSGETIYLRHLKCPFVAVGVTASTLHTISECCKHTMRSLDGLIACDVMVSNVLQASNAHVRFLKLLLLSHTHVQRFD